MTPFFPLTNAFTNAEAPLHVAMNYSIAQRAFRIDKYDEMSIKTLEYKIIW